MGAAFMGNFGDQCVGFDLRHRLFEKFFAIRSDEFAVQEEDAIEDEGYLRQVSAGHRSSTATLIETPASAGPFFVGCGRAHVSVVSDHS